MCSRACPSGDWIAAGLVGVSLLFQLHGLYGRQWVAFAAMNGVTFLALAILGCALHASPESWERFALIVLAVAWTMINAQLAHAMVPVSLRLPAFCAADNETERYFRCPYTAPRFCPLDDVDWQWDGGVRTLVEDDTLSLWLPPHVTMQTLTCRRAWCRRGSVVRSIACGDKMILGDAKTLVADFNVTATSPVPPTESLSSLPVKAVSVHLLLTMGLFVAALRIGLSFPAH